MTQKWSERAATAGLLVNVSFSWGLKFFTTLPHRFLHMNKQLRLNASSCLDKRDWYSHVPAQQVRDGLLRIAVTLSSWSPSVNEVMAYQLGSGGIPIQYHVASMRFHTTIELTRHHWILFVSQDGVGNLFSITPTVSLVSRLDDLVSSL